MLRQPSSRNQRARGFRLKHGLQIGILVAVCIWLLYQVKHSHEKKRAYDARNSKIISKPVENQEDFFKFRKKDLTSIEAAGTASEIHKEETQEDKQPKKQDETEDEEMRGAADEVTDEQNQENVDQETERGEDSTEEEGKEESDLFDSQDHEQGTQAREENYKSDDASSAVVHEQIVDGSKGDNGSTIYGSKIDVAGDDMEKKEMWAETVLNGTVDGSEVNGTIDGSMNNLSDDVKDNSIMPIDSLANNGTAAERKESEAEISSPGDNALVTNSTIVEEKVQADLTNATTADEINNNTELSVNSTASVSENQTAGQNISTVVGLLAEVQISKEIVDSAHGLNTTVDGVSNLENVVDRAKNSNSTAALDSEEQSSTSSATNGTRDAVMGETINDLWQAVTEEERDIGTDLSTLPDIRNEARTMDDDAAE